MALVPRDNDEENLCDHTTEKYMLREKEVLLKESEFEIRINRRTNVGRTLAYIYNNFVKEKTDKVLIKTYGAGISIAVRLVEIAKTKVEGLHQVNRIRCVEIEDEYIPLEEGLDLVKIKKHISVLEITLSKEVAEGEREEIGYQEPLPKEQIVPFEKRRRKKPMASS